MTYDVRKHAKRLKDKLIQERGQSKVSIKDIERLIYAIINDDFQGIKDTRLYNNHSPQYCRLLEFLEWEGVKHEI